jgi:hypothetical protein
MSSIEGHLNNYEEGKLGSIKIRSSCRAQARVIRITLE